MERKEDVSCLPSRFCQNIGGYLAIFLATTLSSVQRVCVGSSFRPGPVGMWYMKKSLVVSQKTVCRWSSAPLDGTGQTPDRKHLIIISAALIGQGTAPLNQRHLCPPNPMVHRRLLTAQVGTHRFMA